uniref:Centrosomal protein of 162 kDa n=1 Tax=Macrostomum lignano TaxID=282301 RepID=A0A1I8GN70_9PLAT
FWRRRLSSGQTKIAVGAKSPLGAVERVGRHNNSHNQDADFSTRSRPVSEIGAERAETALSTSRAEIDRLRRRRQDDETDADAVQQGDSLEAAALALTRQLTLTRRRLAADGRFGEQVQRCVDRLTDSLNEFSRRQNDYYNGKLVRLENRLRYLRAENVRLASRHRGPVPESHYQYEQQPDSSINQLEQLKRRNAHLLESAAERLKSRVRQRPDEDNKLMLSELRRDYEKRRTRDLAENGRQLEEKERELERLRRHYEGLQYMTRSNSGEKDAMERMLQTVQRERLTLQHQLSWNQEFFSDASTEDRLKRLTTDIQRVESARRDLDEEIRRLRESAVRVKS